MKQTATDYFYDRMLKLFIQYHEEDVPTIDFSEIITEAHERAKAMEKEQIIETYNEGALDGLQLGEQYYNHVFKS
jgi:hypothetical protein